MTKLRQPKFFPGMKVKMGAWEYFAIRISFKDLEETFHFSKSLGKKSSLNAYLQRHLNENRATKPMRDFLTNKSDRFYSSIVVANLNDQRDDWIPIKVPQSACPEGIKESERQLGFLEISPDDQYYILDGQHRAASIISIINPFSDFLKIDEKEEGSLDEEILKETVKINIPDLPENFDKAAFKNEELVVLVLNKQSPQQVAAEESYRRLFSSLNRYAKPTDTITNIITSEDDTFYILTRRLIDNFEPFSVEGQEDALDNPNILFRNSFNGGERQFTTLDTLANMNEQLLKTNKFPRLNKKNHKSTGPIRGDRQDDADLDAWYKELEKRWKAIFEVFPEFKEDRSNMRDHNSVIGGQQQDHPYLWPIVQKQIFIKLVKALFDRERSDSEKTYADILEPLAKLEIKDFREPPWEGLLLVKNDKDKFIIRQSSDDQSKVLTQLYELIRYLVNLDQKSKDDLDEMKKKLLPYVLKDDKEKEKFWKECMKKKLKE
tara:strand:+ start:201 stop:1673 length:1473 start_codon:yes stop_codon:yes gene_type:complete